MRIILVVLFFICKVTDMGKKITIDKLGDEIDKIMTEYGEDIERNIKVVQKKVAQKGATALKNKSKDTFEGTGKYASGWSATVKKAGKHYSSNVIYNRKEPTLTHLLEHGHALVRGGRKYGEVKGREHIAPVEEELVDQYLTQVISQL